MSGAVGRGVGLDWDVWGLRSTRTSEGGGFDDELEKQAEVDDGGA